MSALQKLFKTTFIYGIATVLPRIIGVLLTPLYIDKLPNSQYGIYTSLMVYLILGNVVLSYGMETAFFRFVNKSERKATVQSTALTSLAISSVLFTLLSLLARNTLANWLDYAVEFIVYSILILAFDALVVIPFAWFRNQEMPIRYAFVKILNVLLNFILNLFFFLILPLFAKENTGGITSYLLFDNKVHYIFLSNLIASLFTFLMLVPLYFRIGFSFDRLLWKKMFQYAMPVLVAGIAFAINEGFDKLLLRYLLPKDSADAIVGIYGACYKLGVFMTLFVTAFKLGVEPFFFSHANKKNAPQTYANITLYFTIFGAVIFLFIVVYTDIIKHILIPDKTYWEALWIVPFILFANLCLGIYNNLSVWYKVTDKTQYGAYISLIGAFLTLALNAILIPHISYKGSAIATLVAYGSMMLISLYIGQKKYPIPYAYKKMGLYLGISTLFSVISFYLCNRNLYIGSSLLLLFLLVIYKVEKKALKKIIL